MAAAYERAGFANQRAYETARGNAREWSDLHSRSDASKYSRGMSPETFRAYFNAYVSKATGMSATRARRSGGRGGPTRYVRNYLVNVAKVYTREEFDGRYAQLQ